MLIIIDAYNLLKQIIKSSHATERERKHFIQNIIDYSRKKQVAIMLVFDGGSSPNPESTTDRMVKIVYVGYRMSADDYIREYMLKNSKSPLILVSSDIELYRTALRIGIPTIESLAFYELMHKETEKQSQLTTIKSKSTAKKLHKDDEEDNEMLDVLMYGTQQVLIKDEQIKKNNSSKGLNKEDKKLLRIIKKL